MHLRDPRHPAERRSNPAKYRLLSTEKRIREADTFILLLQYLDIGDSMIFDSLLLIHGIMEFAE